MDSPQKGVSPPCKLPNCTPGNYDPKEDAADVVHFGGPRALNNLERPHAKLQGAQVCRIGSVSAKARLTRRFPGIPIMQGRPCARREAAPRRGRAAGVAQLLFAASVNSASKASREARCSRLVAPSESVRCRLFLWLRVLDVVPTDLGRGDFLEPGLLGVRQNLEHLRSFLLLQIVDLLLQVVDFGPVVALDAIDFLLLRVCKSQLSPTGWQAGTTPRCRLLVVAEEQAAAHESDAQDTGQDQMLPHRGLPF